MIRKITYRQLYILVATLLAVTSCTGDDTLTDTKVPMTFTCNAIAQTRAEDGEKFVPYDGPAFGVAAIHHGQSNGPTATVKKYIDNAQVSKQSSVWVTDPIYYWPHQGTMHFAAYSPYMPGLANSNVSITLPWQNENGVGYTYSGTIDGQKNLMFADEQYGSYDNFQNGSVPVPIIFNHALTQVRFRAKMSTASAGTTLNIKSLQLINIRNSGTVNFTHDGTSWNTDGMMWTVDESSDTSYVVVTEAIAGIGTTARACGNPLYLMPQQLTDNQQLKVTYTIGGAEKTATITLKEVGTSTIKEKWTVNQSVTYTLIMSSGNPVSLEVEVDEWIPLDFTHEFSNTVTIHDGGKLRWVEGTYTSINDDKVVMLYDKTQPLKFKFNIAGPLGGTWLAMLITKTGEPDAFELSQTEGAVGQPAEISIKTTGDAVGVSNTAELRFLVRVGTTYLPVDALTTLSDERNYTIVQNIN